MTSKNLADIFVFCFEELRKAYYVTVKRNKKNDRRFKWDDKNSIGHFCRNRLLYGEKIKKCFEQKSQKETLAKEIILKIICMTQK